MCLPRLSGYRFDLLPERVQKAQTAIAAAGKVLTDAQLIEVAFELGFGECVYFADVRVLLDLTDLQSVALAAAIVSVAENKGAQTWR